MKKTIFIIFLFLFISHLVFSEANIPKIDSLINISNELKQQNKELSIKLEGLDKMYDKRFSDLFWFLGGFLTLLMAVLVFNYINANNVARKQASEEIEKLKNTIDNIENKAIEVDRNINLYKQELETISSFRHNAGL